ncbi:hypothetical protein F2Q70_00027899 [Brassica cretica]|uniref:Uncharacterized protein n=1 Tax=Brassica cretica TaxID=69181 RepID=A0A8S9L9G3_BRACR|nr:hypothetical protein F2Q70_00027899 [Brassica cretica]
MASSHCTMRGAVGGLLLRFSDGVVSSRSILNSGNHHRRLLLTIPNTTSNFTHEQKNCTNRQVRKIWISSPLCMGRRSSKIAGRKGAQDSKKAKLYCRIGKEVNLYIRAMSPMQAVQELELIMKSSHSFLCSHSN